MRSRLILTGLFLLAITGNAHCVDLNSTEITKITGKVKVKKTSSPTFKKLRRNLKLSGSLKRLTGGDKVRTQIKSSAEMALKNTCLLSVKEQSLFEVPQQLGEKAIQQLKAQQGSLLFKVVSGSNFEVRTADVIAGVKGTLFEVDVIDNFNSLLETPDLEIGTLAAGGTMVNVYEGNVALTHAVTGKTRTLKAGEGVAVFNNSLMSVDKILQEGFGVIQKFNPATLVQQKFGSQGSAMLQAAPSLNAIQGLTSNSFPNALGTPVSRMNSMFSGLTSPVVQKLQNAQRLTNEAGRIVNEAKEIESIFKGLSGEKFKPNFSRYRPQKYPFAVSAGRSKEVYLGNLTFAGLSAGFGAKKLQLEPTPEGICLTEGFGGVKIKKFHGTKTAAEFQACHYVSGNQYITTVEAIKGELYGRIPGTLEIFKLPKGLNSHVFDSTTGKSKWIKAASNAMMPETLSYKFKVDAELAKQKAKLDTKNEKKRVNTIKKIIRKRPRNLLKGFGF
eukprot:Anaeramoba_ignava/a614323_12.p1 GENE.a614323_12~~a614323_12.p1  ORF type:complete len:501 (-),score=45.86 a614323_12:65-1567(-)